MRIAASYIPHALYAIAITSISMHLVSKRREFEDEKASVNARISILSSIADQLRRPDRHPGAADELEKLKRLAARHPLQKEHDANAAEISWKDVIFGRKPGSDLSHWEKKDLEKVRQEAAQQ